MDCDKLNEINEIIFAKFPYLSAVQPTQKTLPDGNIQLNYSTTVETESKFSMPMIVKVKTSPTGKILALKTSK